MLLKKCVTCLVSMLVIVSTLLVASTVKNENITASGDSEPEGNEGIALNYTYLWKITTALSNIAHEYGPGEIPKGRAFGSWGCEERAANIIYNEMTLNLTPTLTSIKKEKLEPLTNKPFKYYTSMMDVVGYRLTIEHPDYEGWPHQPPYPRTVPQSECFPLLSALSPLSLIIPISYNYTMNENDDVRVIKQFENGWPYTGAFTDEYKIVTCTPVNIDGPIYGNVTIIEDSDELPTNQEGRVFLINETGNYRDILDNITNVSAVILLHSEDPGLTTSEAMNYSFLIVRVDANNENIINVTERLRNGESVDVETTDFTVLLFTFGLCKYWPNYNFMLIVKINTTSEYIFGKTERFFNQVAYWLNVKSKRLYRENPHHQYQCKGLIIYSEKDDQTHYQTMHDEGWLHAIPIIEPFYYLPMFSVNNSVGFFLNSRTNDPQNTINGYINEIYYSEQHDPTPTSGFDAYDIVGHINIPKSPEDKIIVISNRHDSFYGECPIDSGAGAGIVLGIAKYFKDNNITPKYNLTFLQTTGEEYGFRGAQYYSDNHSTDNIFLCIGTDQLGIKDADSRLTLHYDDWFIRRKVSAIANDTHYEERTKYGPIEHQYNRDFQMSAPYI